MAEPNNLENRFTQTQSPKSSISGNHPAFGTPEYVRSIQGNKLAFKNIGDSVHERMHNVFDELKEATALNLTAPKGIQEFASRFYPHIDKRESVKMLQRDLFTLYKRHEGRDIEDDGIIGRITLGALGKFIMQHPELRDAKGVIDAQKTREALKSEVEKLAKPEKTRLQNTVATKVPEQDRSPVGNVHQGISGPTWTLGQTRISRTSPFFKNDNITTQTQTRVATEKKTEVKAPEIKKEEGMLMGILKDIGVQKTIDKVSDAFGIATERMMALITRESNGEVKAKSSTGSKGITQLTTSVFKDMSAYVNEKRKRVGRGIAEYADNLKKIPDEIASAVGGKFEEVVQRIKANVSKEKPDPSQNERDIKELQRLVSQATDKGDYRPNLLLGTLYFSSITDRYRNMPMSKMQKEIKAIGKMNRSFFNDMLESKNFTPLTPSEFEDFKNELVRDEGKMRDFCALASYNGQSNTHHGVRHNIYYAAAIMASEKQIKQSPDGLYRYA